MPDLQPSHFHHLTYELPRKLPVLSSNSWSVTHVFPTSHVWKESDLLEHVSQLSIFRRKRAYFSVSDEYLSRILPDDAGNAVQES